MRLTVDEFKQSVASATTGLKTARNPIEERALQACGKEQSPLALNAFAQDMLNEATIIYSKLPLVCVKILHRYRSHIECFNKATSLWESTPFTSYDKFMDTGIYRVSIDIFDEEHTEDPIQDGETQRASGVDMMEI